MPKAWKVPKADCALIRAINRASVETTLGKLDPFVSQSRWLAKGNRYAINTISRLALDTKPTSSIHATHLAQYISASSILHCTDGWSYLGRAINCLLAGDPHRVVHLAYYAELRAALSLLASEGVGVFKNLHFVVNAANSAKPLPTKGPTHDASWAYLKYWGTLKRSGDLFSEIVTPGGHSLTTWLSAIGGAEKVVRPRAREWFRQWSMDLGSFSDDKDARNDSSYRPDGIPRSWYLSATDALDLAAELWEACEPSSTTQFDRIDRYILRLAVESTFRGTYGKDQSGDIERFIAYTNAIVEPLSLDPAVASEWKQFLRREVARDDPKIFSYAAKDALDRTMGHAAVLARAMLMSQAYQIVRNVRGQIGVLVERTRDKSRIVGWRKNQNRST
jgi:hypothetical protein